MPAFRQNLPVQIPAGKRWAVAVGIEFDFGATDHHLRWQLKGRKETAPADLLEQIGPALGL